MSDYCFAVLQQEAIELLAQINRLSEKEFKRRLHQIFVRDDVSGPLAVAYLLKQMLKISHAENAGFWRSQINACNKAAHVGLKIRRGW